MPKRPSHRRISCVLLVANDPRRAAVLSAILQQAGLRVVCRRSVRAAVRCAQAAAFSAAVVELAPRAVHDPDIGDALDRLCSATRVILSGGADAVEARTHGATRRAFAQVDPAEGSAVLVMHVRRAIQEAISHYTQDLKSVTDERAALIRDMEERYRRLFEMVSDALVLIDNSTGQILEVNAAAVALYGYGRDEWLQLKHTDVSAEPTQTREATVEQRVHVPRRWHRKKDGTVFAVEIAASHFTWQGRPTHLAAIRDISQRIATEKALEESHQRYRRLFEESPTPMWEEDFSAVAAELQRLQRSGVGDLADYLKRHPEVVRELVARIRVVDVNTALVRLHRAVSKAQLLEQLETVIAPSACSVFAEEFAWLAGSQDTFEFEEEALTLDGEKLHVYGRVTRVGGDATASRVLVSVIDITYRKRIEVELKQSREFLQSTLDALRSNIAILDESGRILAVNASWRRFADANDLRWSDYGVGRNYLQVCESARGPSSEGAEAAAQLVRDAIAGRTEGACLEYACHSPSEQRWFVMHATRFQFDHSVRIVLSHENITDRRRAEEESRKRHDELAHIARLNMMGELASGLAHELNQPLATILCGAELLRDTLKPRETDEDVRETLEEMANQAERAGHIIRHLRRLVSKREPQRSMADMNELVREAVGLVDTELRQREVSVRVECAVPRAPVYGDSVQLQQVLLNLIRNAMEAMEAPGLAQRQLTIRTFMPRPDVIQVTVQDTGQGLAPEVADRIFEPFFTSKSEGMGIGLSISRSIIELHGGRLWIGTERDPGATLCFTVPAAEEVSHDAGKPDRVCGG